MNDRDIRDRLAEALRSLEGIKQPWERSVDKPYWLHLADDLLTALQSPTVKLKIEGAE